MPPTQITQIYHHTSEPPLIFLAEEEPELQRSWDLLAYQEGTDTWAENQGEVWQYMGTTFHPQRKVWAHTFRHRCHPHTGERVYVYIPAHLSLTLDMLQPGPISYVVTICSPIGVNGTETIYGIYTHALLVIHTQEHGLPVRARTQTGARIYVRDAQLLARRPGHRFLPERIQLAWAAEHATPSAPAFTFHVDPIDNEVFTHSRRQETTNADQRQCPKCGSGRVIEISQLTHRWYCQNCHHQATGPHFDLTRTPVRLHSGNSHGL